MLQLVGQDAQCQRLRCGKSLLAGRSVDQDSRKVNDLGDPAAVFFALQLDGQSHLVRLAHSPTGSWCPPKYVARCRQLAHEAGSARVHPRVGLSRFGPVAYAARRTRAVPERVPSCGCSPRRPRAGPGGRQGGGARRPRLHGAASRRRFHRQSKRTPVVRAFEAGPEDVSRARPMSWAIRGRAGRSFCRTWVAC